MPHSAPSPSLSVFDTLLRDIVSGKYARGARLPAERELARELGASRPTLREALRRLAEWGLIEARRGSGITVRDLNDWAFDVLPAYMRLGAPAEGGAKGLVRLINDLLDVRRLLFIDVLRLVAPRVTAESLDDARAHVRRAWEARGDISAFIKEDFELVRAIAASARFRPALWMLNSVGGVYLDLAKMITGAAMVPEDYLESHEAVLSALAAHDTEGACAAMARYLEGHDRRLLAVLGLGART
jgi:DNA-binding FadR family transcriptional regulator